MNERQLPLEPHEPNLRPTAKDVRDLLRKQWASGLTILEKCHTTEARSYIAELRRVGYLVEDRWKKDLNSGKRFKQWRIQTT